MSHQFKSEKTDPKQATKCEKKGIKTVLKNLYKKAPSCANNKSALKKKRKKKRKRRRLLCETPVRKSIPSPTHPHPAHVTFDIHQRIALYKRYLLLLKHHFDDGGDDDDDDDDDDDL